jgi:hypothetical protein
LAQKLTHKVYRLTKKQGYEKDPGLKRQIQEAAGSAMHNEPLNLEPLNSDEKGKNESNNMHKIRIAGCFSV